MGLLTNQVAGDRRLAGFPIIGNPTLLLNTLQFDSVNNEFIWVAASGGSTLSEVEFLQGKSASGDMRNVTGELNDANGAVITITPPNGTTTVIYRADFMYNMDGTGRAVVTLIVDGTTIERKGNDLGGLGVQVQQQNFLTKGLQMIGNGTRTITITVSGFTATSRIDANMELYDL